MSTGIHYVCIDHDPPLWSEEVGLHRDLHIVRKFLAEHITETAAWRTEYWLRNAKKFLGSHPDCRIEIRDEYGVTHPLTEPLLERQ